MSNDEIVKQLQQIVSTLQQIVQASGELAGRVETLEQQAGEKLGMLTSLQGIFRCSWRRIKSRYWPRMRPTEPF